MLQPICLQIIKGIPPAPSDPNSAEAPMLTLDLLDTDGLALELPDGWSPNLPALKNGGTWVESAVSDGRQLLASAVGNVTETLTLVCGNADVQQRFGILKTLGILQQAARDFAEGFQIDPVYLKWHAAEGVGAQYALIANIEIAHRGDVFDANSWTITITIEREPYWRGLWPGANPLEWHFLSQGKIRGSAGVEGYDYNDLRLDNGSDNFHTETIQNRCEFSQPAYTTFLSKNFVDIDAEDIPGDAPALVYAAIYSTDTPSQKRNRLLVARSTKPRQIENRASGLTVGTDYPAFGILNVGDASNTGITKATDTCGVISNGSNTQAYIGTYSVAGGATAVFTEDVILWTDSGTPYKNINLFKGQWAAFLRCKATNGATGDVRIRLVIRDSNFSQLILDEQPLPILTPAANCANEWALVSLGQFQIPFDGAAFSSPDGRGLWGAAGGLDFEIQTRNTNAAIRTTEFLDLIFMPVDEAFCITSLASNTDLVTGNLRTIILDKTGYSSHGADRDIAMVNTTIPGTGVDAGTHSPQELTGELPTLVPGVDNRLYFLYTSADNNDVEYSPQAGSIQVRLNIIPRWVGVRDS